MTTAPPIPSMTTVVAPDAYGRARLTRAWVDSDVLDIARRVREGDPIAGWRGDPNATVWVEQLDDPLSNTHTYLWGVDMIDARGQQYQAASMIADRLDHRIIEKLVLGDWQNGVVAAERIMQANTDLIASREKARREATEEWADKFHWALLRDHGGRRQWAAGGID